MLNSILIAHYIPRAKFCYNELKSIVLENTFLRPGEADNR